MKGINGITPDQAEAIRRFFTDPQESYSHADAQAIMGAFFDMNEWPFPPHSAEVVADFMRGYLLPTIPGALLGDAASEALRLESLTIELPAWQVRALERVADAIQGTISDAIAVDLLSAHDGGVLTVSDDAWGAPPDYQVEAANTRQAEVSK